MHLEALAPTGDPPTGSTNELVQASSSVALRNRHEPFVTTRLGLLPPDAVVLPPDTDDQGFWAHHFSGDNRQAMPRSAGLSPSSRRPAPHSGSCSSDVGVGQLRETAMLDLMGKRQSPRHSLAVAV